MSYLEALVLGVVQGLTEFIPVSSSGHLVLVHEFFGSTTQDLSFDAILQLATVLAVFVYFRKEIIDLVVSFFKIIFRKSIESEKKTFTLAIISGTIPALVLGILLESKMETVFRAPFLVALALIAGSILMFVAEKYYEKRKSFVSTDTLSVKGGFIVGLFQALALIPGVSRSGATISGGIFSGLSRDAATRFSFLLSFPIIFGSGLKKLIELGDTSSVGGPLLLAFFLSFAVGIFAIHFLIKFLQHNSLKVFVWYRALLAIAILFFI
jgi:undecaprenyl-diphosphatase